MNKNLTLAALALCLLLIVLTQCLPAQAQSRRQATLSLVCEDESWREEKFAQIRLSPYNDPTDIQEQYAVESTPFDFIDPAGNRVQIYIHAQLKRLSASQMGIRTLRICVLESSQIGACSQIGAANYGEAREMLKIRNNEPFVMQIGFDHYDDLNCRITPSLR